MGWTKVRNVGTWGDLPQNEVDEFLEELKFNWTDPGTISVKRRYARMTAKSKELKERVDKLYKEQWGRPATQKEFLHLIKIGLHLK